MPLARRLSSACAPEKLYLNLFCSRETAVAGNRALGVLIYCAWLDRLLSDTPALPTANLVVDYKEIFLLLLLYIFTFAIAELLRKDIGNLNVGRKELGILVFC